MALLPIIKYGNPILRMKAAPVEPVTYEIRQLAENMMQTMQANDGIGLAAPQVAQSLAMVVVDVGLIEKGAVPQAYLNPEILEAEGSDVMEEGCLSVPEIREEVVRPERIRIKYQTLGGEHYDIWVDGLLARVLQHEVDHLNGVFFVDRISGLKKKLISKDLKKIAQEETRQNQHAA